LFFEEGFDPGYDMTLKMLKKAVIGMWHFWLLCEFVASDYILK
jgi:hypothetical protein